MTSEDVRDESEGSRESENSGDSDWEYDMAHEGDTPDADPHGAERHRAEQQTYVVTETPDFGGDYGYDMAHDVSGR